MAPVCWITAYLNNFALDNFPLSDRGTHKFMHRGDRFQTMIFGHRELKFQDLSKGDNDIFFTGQCEFSNFEDIFWHPDHLCISIEHALLIHQPVLTC